MNFQQLWNFDWVSKPGAWIGLLTLVVLEIVLGIDNIVFITILAGKLPPKDQPRGRSLGMVLAVIPRIVLLLFIPLVLSLSKPLFTVPFPDPGAHVPEGAEAPNLGISVQDLIVLAGGLFLLAKSVHEIHHKLEGAEHLEGGPVKAAGAFTAVMIQIMLLNIVFSLDSIITAIGMIPKEQVMVMILAVLIATGIMAISVNAVSAFVERHPSVKMLALAFLLLIGTTLIGEGLHVHVPKGYVYFAMAFTVFVELLNLKATSRNSRRVQLNEPKL